MPESHCTDGIHGLVPPEKMSPVYTKFRITSACTPGAPFYQREFGYYCLERWKEQGMPQDVSLAELFGYDPPSQAVFWGLGWCESTFFPMFEEQLIEDRGEHEVVSDKAGRHVLYFKGRRSGFMPEYIDHPVKD